MEGLKTVFFEFEKLKNTNFNLRNKNKSVSNLKEKTFLRIKFIHKLISTLI